MSKNLTNKALLLPYFLPHIPDHRRIYNQSPSAEYDDTHFMHAEHCNNTLDSVTLGNSK